MDSQTIVILMNLTYLSEKQQLDIYALAHGQAGISQVVLEKDWWVTTVLRALFSLTYADEINAVVPERTFWEKICLLHEEFAKPHDLMRTERMSRHLYDLVQIMDTPVAEKALTNKDLYNSIVEHRRIFVGLKGFDYSTLATKTINIVPSENVIDFWKVDYEIMQNTMIYGSSLPFNKLIVKIKQLNERINQIDW